MLSFDSQTFSWLGRRLMSYAKGGTTTNYTYNSDGIRTKKVSGSATTDYCLNGTQILAEKRGSTLINYLYASDGTRVGFKTGGKVYYYVYNLQGDVTHIVDESRNIAATYRYDPFGKILNLSSLTNIGKLNPFRYRGYYYDTESNLYYLNSRYYNPEIGRFINAEPNIDYGKFDKNAGLIGFNVYSYCANNPINCIDPTGEFAISTAVLIGVGVGALIGGIIGGIYGHKKAEKNNVPKNERWKPILKNAVGGATIGGIAGGLIGYGAGVALGAEASSGIAIKSVSKAVSSIGKNSI